VGVLLDGNQAAIVSTKRLKPTQRPKFYNASIGAMTRISEDFEAFLILQGRPRNKETVNWLQNAGSYAIQDADRDSLINSAINNELEDATAGARELAPVIDQFTQFRTRFNMTGFEGVTEAGQLLADLQRPMNEIITLGSKQRHRQQYARILNEQLVGNGLTANQTKQMNSWFESLTTY
jgi:hypothetical protein